MVHRYSPLREYLLVMCGASLHVCVVVLHCSVFFIVCLTGDVSCISCTSSRVFKWLVLTSSETRYELLSPPR